MTLCLTTSLGQVSRSHKKTMKTVVAVHIPHEILKAPIVVQAVVQNKIFSSALSAVIYEIVVTLEGDPSKLSLSYASTEQRGIEAILENWTPPAFANIHWDGKLMNASE